MLVFWEFNEREVEIIRGRLDSEVFTTGMATFELKEHDPYNVNFN